ncbi:MAG: hypothetical protein MZV63_72400 [Marinilabiliales bacterium]|nr:hypothetical protein [Marinilabiliales bacterium]
MNKGEKLPISWTLGITPGYLLSSNALVQDSSQAMYYHPDNQRRFQLGFRTGILFRLMPAAAHPLGAGTCDAVPVEPRCSPMPYSKAGTCTTWDWKRVSRFFFDEEATIGFPYLSA